MAMKKGELSPEVVPKVFELEDYGQIRFVWKGKEIWFVATDVCRALEIKNVTGALAKLDDDEKDKIPENGVVTDPTYYEGSTVTPFLHKINIISEPGLYRLVFASRKKKAKEFQRKVYHEVLPSIREYGYYSVTEKPAEKPLTEREKLIKKINDEDPDDEIEFTGITLDTIRDKQVISYGCKLHGELAEKIWAEFLTGKTAFALMTYEKNIKDE